MGFFPTLFALEKKISSLAKCLLRGVMKLLEKGSGPVRAVKLLGQFCQEFHHQYCPGLCNKRQEASLLLTTTVPTTAFTVPK